MFEFDTRLGKKEVGALNAFHTFVKNPFMMPLFMAVFGGWFLYSFFDERDFIYLAMAVVFGLGFPGLCFLMMKFMTWLNIRSSAMISEENRISFKFSADRIEYRTEMPGMSSTTVMDWKLLHKAFETKRYYFLYLSNLQSFILPKAAMTAGSVPDFTRMLQDRLGKKYTRRFLREKK
jgi:hypothetical protein